MSRVNFCVVESPYAPPKGVTPEEAAVALARNLAYVRAAMNDCFKRGEVPFASHALYTQPGVLDDTIPAERTQGIQGGFRVAEALQVAASVLTFIFGFKRVFYGDRGFSSGMELGIEDAKTNGQAYEVRGLGIEWSQAYDIEYHIVNGVLERKP